MIERVHLKRTLKNLFVGLHTIYNTQHRPCVPIVSIRIVMSLRRIRKGRPAERFSSRNYFISLLRSSNTREHNTPTTNKRAARLFKLIFWQHSAEKTSFRLRSTVATPTHRTYVHGKLRDDDDDDEKKKLERAFFVCVHL
jgi:hypothetical protein